MSKTLRLKQDIIIPAGTEFTVAPKKIERYGEGHYESVFDLSGDSSGSIYYFIDPDDPVLLDWFDEAEMETETA